MRKRSLMPAMSVMRYMNLVGITPQLLIGESVSTKKELDLYKVKYKEITKLPDYDVMFSEANGHIPFEIHWLTESRKRRKINVSLINSLSAVRIPIPTFFPDKTKLLDGICMKAEVHLLQYSDFTKGLFLVNVGDPDWDWWKTDEFKEKVRGIKERFGNKILVLCGVFVCPEFIPYIEFCIKKAESLGFKPIINYHPDRWSYVPEKFHKYCNRSIHHHVLFSAASHLIVNIDSTVVSECLFLETKIGCSLAIYHYIRRGNHVWLDKDAWVKEVSKRMKQEIIDMVEFVFDENDLERFLSSSKSIVSMEQAAKAFGRIDVPCYSEYLFKTLDKKLKND